MTADRRPPMPHRQVGIFHRGVTASMWALAHRAGFWEQQGREPKEKA